MKRLQGVAAEKRPFFGLKSYIYNKIRPMRFLLTFGLLAALFSCTEPATRKDMDAEKAATFDWQGHRGARGLLPENTVPAFLKALEYPQVKTLELDLAVSRDSQLVVSHEPWMSHHICSHPDGRPVLESEEEDLLFYQMPYDSIRQYDCGSRGNERFPEQKAQPAHKPLLSEVVQAVEQYCQEKGRPRPRYNIEIKLEPAYDGVKAPGPETFARLVLEEIARLGIKDWSCIQSFDVRPLQQLHRMDPQIFTALLIENAHGVDANLNELGYTPGAYSPYYKLVTANVVKTVHEKGMALIPWTVNDTTAMKALIALGVDGIITDYPNLIGGVE
ncbi:MAG: glycerophosphodiester phosphodiesterase [Lewinellaceae bacterium]|nr:glycerophosphodiester phosphodiesterase [Phaeodactylibacter sp.]MCB9035311.1 glycerophosphodiester phosphodiesterase [Lewinellaceae bacterium]